MNQRLGSQFVGRIRSTGAFEAMAKPRWRLGVLVLALMVRTSSALAEVGAAAALFSSGREAFRHGDFVTAREKFRESERIEPAVGTELNLGLCEEQLGHLTAAWHLLQLVVDRLPPGDERIAITHDHVERVGRRLARFTPLAGDDWPTGAILKVGSTRLTRWGLGTAIPTDPGDTELIVMAPGRVDKRYQLHLDEGDAQVIVVQAGALAASPMGLGHSGFARAQASTSKRTAGILAVGAGGSLVVVGALAGLQVLSAKATMERECDATHACSPEGLSAASRGRVLSVVGTAAFAAGAGLGALGVWFLVGEHSARGRPFGNLAAGIDVHGATLRGRFE